MTSPGRRLDGTNEYARECVALALETLDDTERSLRARVRDAALFLAMRLRQDDMGPRAWATYTAFRESTTRREDDVHGSIARTTINLAESQAEAAATLLRELAAQLGPPRDFD